MTTINSLEEFLQALDDNPSWRDAVRARILGEELLQLPQRFNTYVEQQTGFNQQVSGFIEEQKQFNEEQKQFNQHVSGFIEEQKQFNLSSDARMERIETRVASLETGVNRLDATVRTQSGRIANALGTNYEARVERNLPAIAAEHLRMQNTVVLRGSRPDHNPALKSIVEEAVREGRITLQQSADFWPIDLVFTGQEPGAETPTYVAAEVSITATQEDVTRAARRARILAIAAGHPVTAAVVATNIDHRHRLTAQDVGVTVLTHSED